MFGCFVIFYLCVFVFIITMIYAAYKALRMTNSNVESIFEWPIESSNQPSGYEIFELRHPSIPYIHAFVALFPRALTLAHLLFCILVSLTTTQTLIKVAAHKQLSRPLSSMCLHF